jgi:C4-dicarboxylate transporter, DctM subunit
VAPFILTDLVRLALLVAFPWIVLFLPTTMG